MFFLFLSFCHSDFSSTLGITVYAKIIAIVQVDVVVLFLPVFNAAALKVVIVAASIAGNPAIPIVVLTYPLLGTPVAKPIFCVLDLDRRLIRALLLPSSLVAPHKV